MTKWIGPAPYFGVYFGSGEATTPGAMSCHAVGGCTFTAPVRGWGDVSSSIHGSSTFRGDLEGGSSGYADMQAHVVGSGSLSATAIQPNREEPHGGNGYGPGKRPKKIWEVIEEQRYQSRMNKAVETKPSIPIVQGGPIDPPVNESIESPVGDIKIERIDKYGIGHTETDSPIAIPIEPNPVDIAARMAAEVVAKRQIKRIEAEAKTALLDAEMEEAVLLMMALMES